MKTINIRTCLGVNIAVEAPERFQDNFHGHDLTFHAIMSLIPHLSGQLSNMTDEEQRRCENMLIEVIEEALQARRGYITHD